MPKFPDGEEFLLISMVDTPEIEYTLVPNTKEKSDLWKHFNLHERKTDGWIDAAVVVCKHCNSVVKLAGGTSVMSTHEALPFLIVASPGVILCG